MKKILIIFSLIYFISCKTLCDAQEELDNAEDCFNREAQDNYNCCYLTVKDSSGSAQTQCFEGPIGMDRSALKEALVAQIQAGYTLSGFDCPKVEEKEKLRCADTTVPSDYNQCFDRTIITKGNYCCYYKLTGEVNDIGCMEIPSSYHLDTVKEKYFKEYLEKGISVDALVCPTEQKAPEGNYCSSDRRASSKRDCFTRKTEGDRNDYYCCYMKVAGMGQEYYTCSEFHKSYSQSEIEKIMDEQYSPYGFKTSDLVCPTPGEENPSDTPIDSNKDATSDTNKDGSKTGSKTGSSDSVKDTNKGSYLRPELLLIFVLLI